MVTPSGKEIIVNYQDNTIISKQIDVPPMFFDDKVNEIGFGRLKPEKEKEISSLKETNNN